MAKFEDVLPALRAGKKVRVPHSEICADDGYIWAQGSKFYSKGIGIVNLSYEDVNANDWEIVPEPKRVADYFVRWQSFYHPLEQFYKRATYKVGTQPDGAVMVPNSEREISE